MLNLGRDRARLHKTWWAAAIVRGLLAVALLVLLAEPSKAQPTCSACGKPLVGTYYRLADGRRLCPADYERLGPRCVTCGGLIVGAYVVLDSRHTVCRSCHERFPACFVCGLPSGRSGRRLSDGRALCAEHVRQAVVTTSPAEAVLHQAENVVLAALGPQMRLEHPVDVVRVVDGAALKRLLGRRAQADGHVLGLFHLQVQGFSRRYTVYFISGLPRERLLTVAAHEFAHAWHSEQNARYLECSSRMREGFAEWVAFKVNQHLGRQEECDRMLAEKSGPYAEGLRHFLQVDRQAGAAAALALARTRTDF